MFSHYYYFSCHRSNSNFTKERRIYKHIWTYFVYNYVCSCTFIYIFIWKIFSRIFCIFNFFYSSR